jgi:hypothetical protein
VEVLIERKRTEWRAEGQEKAGQKNFKEGKGRVGELKGRKGQSRGTEKE